MDLSSTETRSRVAVLEYYSASGLHNLMTKRLVAIHPNDVHPREGSIRIPLTVALGKGHLDVARVLLEHGACACFNRYCDWTPLHFVSYGSDIDAMRLLLEYGTDVGCRTDIGQSPLHLASGVGCPMAAQLLLEYGTDRNKRMCSGLSPLHRAVSYGHVSAVHSYSNTALH